MISSRNLHEPGHRLIVRINHSGNFRRACSIHSIVRCLRFRSRGAEIEIFPIFLAFQESQGKCGPEFKTQFRESAKNIPFHLFRKMAKPIFHKPVPVLHKKLHFVSLSVPLPDQDPMSVHSRLDFIDIHLPLNNRERNALPVTSPASVIGKNRKIHFPSRTIKLAFSQVHNALLKTHSACRELD
jgi:hypothetical protein